MVDLDTLRAIGEQAEFAMGLESSRVILAAAAELASLRTSGEEHRPARVLTGLPRLGWNDNPPHSGG